MSASKRVSGVECEEVGTRRVPTPRVPETECEPSVPGADGVELTGPSPRVEIEPCPRVARVQSTPDGPLRLIPADSNDDYSSDKDVDNDEQEYGEADAP